MRDEFSSLFIDGYIQWGVNHYTLPRDPCKQLSPPSGQGTIHSKAIWAALLHCFILQPFLTILIVFLKKYIFMSIVPRTAKISSHPRKVTKQHTLAHNMSISNTMSHQEISTEIIFPAGDSGLWTNLRDLLQIGWEWTEKKNHIYTQKVPVLWYYLASNALRRKC